MKIGKLPNDMLEKLVFNNIKNKREEVMLRAGIGEDCSVINFGEYGCVVSTDPITGTVNNIGSLAVNISCNDVASNGAEPIGLLMTIMAPESTTEEDIELVMKDAGRASAELNVEIIGGHTEITDAVNRMIISTTVIGRQHKDNILKHSDIEVGDKVLMTKVAGVEGTAIIANDLEEKLKGKISYELIKEAKKLMGSLSVVKEGRICGELGVAYMHDVTEGGLLGAIWESAKAINKGVKIDKHSIPIARSTTEICEYLDINPLRLISSGSMIIIAKQEKTNMIINELKANNIGVTIIGEVIEEGVLLVENGVLSEIEPPESDELYKALL